MTEQKKLTPSERFQLKQKGMPDRELVQRSNKEIERLCKTGGKSFTISIPVRVTDSDIILSEVIRRLEDKSGQLERACELFTAVIDGIPMNQEVMDSIRAFLKEVKGGEDE